MKHKFVNLEFKVFDGNEGIVEGLATTFGFPADRDGDVINAKAFDNSIKKINKEGIPLLDGHSQGSVKNVIGTIFSAKKINDGVWIKARLAETHSNMEIYQKLQQGHINKFSIGFITKSDGFIKKDGQTFREILDADMLEVSLVAIPANPRAEVLAVKSAETSEVENTEVAETTEEVASSEEVAEASIETEESSKVDGELKEEGVKLENDCSREALELEIETMRESLNLLRQRLIDG